MDSVRVSPTALLFAAMAMFLFVGCKEDTEPHQAPPAQEQSDPTSSMILGGQEVALPEPVVHVRMYPDMAVPGRRVAVEATVTPQSASDIPKLDFRLKVNPCDGKLERSGNKVVFEVPKDCQGSELIIEVVVSGQFGELVRTARFDVKKAGRLESVVLKHPIPGDRLTSPIFPRWDHTLYLNRSEKLFFEVRRQDVQLLQTAELAPEDVVEIDVPPSPEPVWMVASTTGGTQENLELRIFDRQVPEIPRGALVIDTFSDAEKNDLGHPRRVIDDGGEIHITRGSRLSLDGDTGFLGFKFQVSRKKRSSMKESRMGFVADVKVRSTLDDYTHLVVWMRGDPIKNNAKPVRFEVVGTKGSKKTFRLMRFRDVWSPYQFPLYRAIRPGESVESVSVFVDASEVTPPLGLFLVGAIYLEPKNVPPPEPTVKGITPTELDDEEELD